MPKIRLDDCEPAGHLAWRPDAAAIRHLTKSLRVYEGAAVEGLSASDGKIYFLRLARDDEGFILRASGGEDGEPTSDITLIVGMTKADQFEAVLRACGELGIARVIPLMCARSIPRFSSAELPKKAARWGKILAEATKVSGIAVPPRLDLPTTFGEIDWEGLPTSRYAAMLSPAARPLARALTPPPLAVAIGPEGDWTDDESASLIEHGFAPVSLGTRVLRASTAAIACVAVALMGAQAEGPRA